MSPKSVVKWTLLAFVAVCLAVLAGRSFCPSGTAKPALQTAAAPQQGVRVASSAPGSPEEIASKDCVFAIYFVGRVRCKACKTIESLTKKAIEGGFADDLASGRLAMRQVNVDLPGNEHFTADFEMANRTLVLAEYRGGEAVRFEKLDQVWELYDDPKAFVDYVRTRLRTFLAVR